MEGMMVHSSPSKYLEPPAKKRKPFVKPPPRRQHNNNNNGRNAKRPRDGSVSSTAEGNGKQRRNLPEETDSDMESAEERAPVGGPARQRVHTRLNEHSSGNERDDAETPKARRLVQSSSFDSPDAIDSFAAGSSPPPTHVTPHDDSTPRAFDDSRMITDYLGLTPVKSPLQARSKSSSNLDNAKRPRANGIRPSQSMQVKTSKDRQPVESLQEIFESAPKKSYVSTSSVGTRKPAQKHGNGPQSQRLEEKSQCASLPPKDKRGKSRPERDASKTPTRPAAKPRKSDKATRATKKASLPPERFSDDESEVSTSKAKKTSRSRKARDEPDNAELAKRALQLRRETSLRTQEARDRAEEDARIMAQQEKVEAEQREEAEKLDQEDRHREKVWRGAQTKTLQGESFFASATTVDISETEQRIARAQAAIDAQPIKLSQETDNGEDGDSCAQFCNYDDRCSVCDGPMPKEPSNDLLKLRKKLKQGAHRTQAMTFCTMHRAETSTIPLGWREGYPKELDFSLVDTRLEEGFIRDRIRRVANRPSISRFFRRAVKDIERVGLTKWQSITSQSSDTVLSTATPGYYGDLGRAIIIHHYQHLVKWRLLKLHADIHPLSSADFIIHVLVPEAAILLIMEDGGWEGPEARDKEAFNEERKRAMDTHRQSGEYGRAAFREESVLGREILGKLDASRDAKRKMLEGRAREEANLSRPEVIEVLSSDTVDPSSDYGDDQHWLNDAAEIVQRVEAQPAKPSGRPKLPCVVPARMAKISSQYR